MLATLEILLPIFGLILAGFLCRRRGLLGPSAASELNRFVVWLALPALLFDIMAHASWAELDQPGYALAFAGGCALLFVLVLVVRLRQGRHLADASIDAIAAAYPNVGYIGFPLALMAFGSNSLAPTTIATILVACVLFALAIVLIEVGLQAGGAPHRIGIKVFMALARNPLIVSPLLGVAVCAAHWPMPAGVEAFLKLLMASASPCALVSLGLFLAEKRPAGDTSRIALALTVAKLVVQPAITAWLAASVFRLPVQTVGIAVLLAALPTGTGPFMLAEYYSREARVTSRTILFSTVISLFTLSVLLWRVRSGA